VVFVDDGSVLIAERIAVVSPNIEVYSSKLGPVIAFVMKEPMRDDRGDLWRVLLAQNVTAVGDRHALAAYEPSAARAFSLSFFSITCVDKPSADECLTDLINNVVQRQMAERFGIRLSFSKYFIAIDTSAAQIERMARAFHADINAMLTAAYAEFQHWLQNVRTFERLAKALARRGMSWALLIVIAIALLVMLPVLLPQIMNMLHGLGLWR